MITVSFKHCSRKFLEELRDIIDLHLRSGDEIMTLNVRLDGDCESYDMSRAINAGIVKEDKNGRKF